MMPSVTGGPGSMSDMGPGEEVPEEGGVTNMTKCAATKCTHHTDAGSNCDLPEVDVKDDGGCNQYDGKGVEEKPAEGGALPGRPMRLREGPPLPPPAPSKRGAFGE